MPTPEQLEKWKEQYGDVLVIEIDGLTGYARPLFDFKVLKPAFAALDVSQVAFAESLVNNSWLGGDETLRTDENLFSELAELLQEQLDIPEFEVEKLPGEALDRYRVTVDGHSCELRRPRREEIRLAQERNTRRKPFETNRFLLDRIWISGDDKLRTDVRLLVGLLPAVNELRDRKVASLKKL